LKLVIKDSKANKESVFYASAFHSNRMKRVIEAVPLVQRDLSLKESSSNQALKNWVMGHAAAIRLPPLSPQVLCKHA
jgi:hypothetical protein